MKSSHRHSTHGSSSPVPPPLSSSSTGLPHHLRTSAFGPQTPSGPPHQSATRFGGLSAKQVDKTFKNLDIISHSQCQKSVTS
ncbi:hypothetical protein CROQUDRAFT_306309 [Cronartium quercuum f. sp. fusiforme G11]|uniref:Uncharacterized protein n=1 Tax=Cronartium quercuum f. sp. fusiforme G11 TaxID=708437 RepID=A0A9P6NBU1_9BASI|nr:hypothetical protein CROQUDRAFT_306309 [Cronartium quercuum f. sp. fusiforme G11]